MVQNLMRGMLVNHLTWMNKVLMKNAPAINTDHPHSLDDQPDLDKNRTGISIGGLLFV
jgi:hypothetical protein